MISNDQLIQARNILADLLLGMEADEAVFPECINYEEMENLHSMITYLDNIVVRRSEFFNTSSPKKISN